MDNPHLPRRHPIDNPHTVELKSEWCKWLEQQLAYTVSGGSILIPTAGVSYEVLHETKTAKVAQFTKHEVQDADRIITERLFRELGWTIIETDEVRSIIEYEGKNRVAMIDSIYIDEPHHYRRTP